MQRVPVLDLQGKALMPMKASRARRFLEEGKAKIWSNDLNLFAIQLVNEPSGRNRQAIVIGIDPGKLFAGIGVQTSKATLLKLHLVLPFPRVRQRMESRQILRRARRGRRINRKIAYSQRCHRAKRFSNRRRRGLPPSINANKRMELRVIKEVQRLYPVTHFAYEIVKAKGSKGFSPVMQGQQMMLAFLKKRCGDALIVQEGWQTSNLRQHLGLPKNKTDKSVQSEETHANDGVALACSYFVKWREWKKKNTRGGEWISSVEVTKAPFRVVARPNYYRRQLHFENPDSKKPNLTQYRKRKGGTITPFGCRLGDFVQAEKAGQIYRGWIGGYSNTHRIKLISIYDSNWRRIGQFVMNKVTLLKRSTRLLITTTTIA